MLDGARHNTFHRFPRASTTMKKAIVRTTSDTIFVGVVPRPREAVGVVLAQGTAVARSAHFAVRRAR